MKDILQMVKYQINEFYLPRKSHAIVDIFAKISIEIDSPLKLEKKDSIPRFILFYIYSF